MSRRILCMAAAHVLSFGRTVLGAPSEAPPAWVEIDRLVQEHKLNEASARLDELLAVLQQSGDEAAWARGLAALSTTPRTASPRRCAASTVRQV
jgi:hypothetical protein